ncbi:hypothetical protein R9C00_22565 [Flammeovirgaceae bacterium SG7u.111]|nr:hypothetical protein [Flammeovirgaceae bacterium SG7u.132]WPO34487.1 hypothetical protein R9C00_22565 [Flammeovirgaceae bacterium SG7u.111]
MFFNYRLEMDLDKVFSEKFEVLLLETYTELEENDPIVLIGKLKLGKSRSWRISSFIVR